MRPQLKIALRVGLKILLVVFGLIAVLLVAAVGYVVSKPTLNEAIRSELGGSYIQLSKGVTHYELNRVSGTAPLVVLYAGVTVPMMVYDKVVPALNAAGYSTLRFDYYGRGLSDRPRITYTTELYAAQGIELLDALKIKDSVHVIGISLGGAVVARIALLQPRRIASITLIGPAVAFSQESADEQKWNFIKERTQIFKKDPPPSKDGKISDPEAFKPHIKKQFEYAGVEYAFISIAMNESPFAYLALYKELGRRNTGIPMEFIWGEKDNHFPLASGRRLAAIFPDAEFHVIKGGGHTPHYGQATVVNPLLVSFLQKLEQ